jgi:very-short-patch-repair endonuclease
MGSQVDISTTIASWQTKLLQLDRRNSLLYFRGQRSSVGIIETGPDDLLDRLQRSRTGLKFPYAEARRKAGSLSESDEERYLIVPGDFEADIPAATLQKRLLSLYRKDRVWEEEQGVNVLFVALGFLNWVDEDGEIGRAPLLLVPADLERDSPRDPWRLKLEADDVQINETLRYQLSTLGVELPEYNHDLPSAYLGAVTQALHAKRGWSVDPALALATFPFAKMAMWEDLDEMRRQGSAHPVVRALAGDQEALRPPRDVASLQLPRDEDLHGGGLDNLLPVKEQFTILPADHSQLRAIETARRGGHMVVHGPPGTGKSQTIANLIGTLLADGKRVLFVSEKTAALDVVKRRLEECELGGFCLDLHSSRARKASVYQQIREALEAPRSAADSFPLAKLEEQRERLNTVARALHEKRHPLGLSVFEVHGRFARLRSLPRVDFPLGSMEILTSKVLSEIQEATARIARRKDEFDTHRTSPWRSLLRTDVSLEMADELRQAAVRMRDAVSDLQASGALETKGLGLPPPENPSDIESAERIASHMANCTGIPESWLDRNALDRLRPRAADLAAMQSDRHSLEESLKPFFGNELPALDFRELEDSLNISFADARSLEDSLGVTWKEQICPHPHSCERDLRDATDCIRKLRDVAALLARTIFGKDRLDRISQVRSLSQRVRTALNMTPVPESWFDPNGFSSVRTSLEQARGQLAKLGMAERGLFNNFEESLLRQVSHEMLVRYRTDHQSPWRFFRKSYRDDQRALRGCLRTSRKLKMEDALAVVQSALEVCDLRENWAVNAEEYTSLFGSRFSGRATDWDLIRRAVTDIESLTQVWGWGPESAKLCFSAPGRAAVEPLIRDLEVSLAEWEASSLARREVESDTDLSIRQRDLESGVEIVSRLSQGGDPLWPYLRTPVMHWSQLVNILSWAVQLKKIQFREEELAPALRKDFEGYYDGPESDWEPIQSAIRWTYELLDLVSGRISAELAGQCRLPHSSDHYVGQKERLITAMSVFEAQAVKFSESFDSRQVGWEHWQIPKFERLKSWLGWIEEHADSASAWVEYAKAVRDLDSFLSPGAVDALREATDDADQLPGLVLRRIYATWIDYFSDRDQRLAFQPRDHEALREEFKKLDRRFVYANRARVRLKCFREYPEERGPAIEWGQLGTLNWQLSLKRRQMPVRQLVQQIPQVLQALKPCFLMSPVAISQYLSRGDLAMDLLAFDTVIFDEASQVFPQDAVPAIARAKQVIVVGDQKQLPPTSFFRSDAPEEEDEELTEDRLEGAESILDVMVGMAGAGVQSAYLGIHYRSRHEDLIRYSNHHFYGDRLLTFPSPDRTSGTLGMKDVYLPSGRYDAGASRTNPIEAEAAVHHVFELLRNRPADESVGVVTLSRSQAELIEELINRRRLQDSSLDSRFAEELGERFFVKNLENVQGDERDHIVLSIGYGPTVGSGSVPNRFGPINREGGGRRLNVAVTRARRSLTLIRSLRPDQITAESDGSRLLRQFLEYAQDPVRVFENKNDVDPAAETESPFEESVYRALTQRGHRVSKQVGCFGYRIDLAIATEDGSRYDLGIECDGATYHRAPAARDRDWLRQSVLEGLGWTIHRIWSTDWIRDPGAQIQSLEGALQAARMRTRETKWEGVPTSPGSDSLSGVTKRDSGNVDGNQTSRIAKEFRFNPYQLADLPKKRLSILDESQERLSHLVISVVKTEGPVHVDVVIDRIRRSYGAGRAGSQIRSIVTDAVNSVLSNRQICYRKIEGSSGHQVTPFLDAFEHPARPEPRGLAEDGSVRRIEQVWLGEIEEGVLRVVEATFGVSREEAPAAVARAFGYERVGRNIQEAIVVAIERLLKAGELIEGPGGLTRSR